MLFFILVKAVKKSLQLLLLATLLNSCRDTEDSIKPKLTPLTESVYASLTIQPDSLYNVHSAVSGIIDKVLIIEGDTVQGGTPLIKVTNTNPNLNLQNAKLALELARDNYMGKSSVLNELREEVAIAKLRFSNDSLNFVKQKNLWSQNIGSKNDFESRELAFNTSRASLELLSNRLQRSEEELKTNWLRASNNYKNALTINSDHTVRSKIQGCVYGVLKEPGEIVSPQEPLATIGSSHLFAIEMEVDEVDIARVKNDQKVIVKLDAYGGKTFNAIVSRIYPRKDLATQTFKVEARFENQPRQLLQGLSGEANIIVHTSEQTLTIPRTYLDENNRVRTDQGLVEVETGLKSLERIEILNGIDTNTNLFLPKP